jgi:hypothetical protein
MKDLKSPAFQEKFRRGPVALITVRANEMPSMAKSLTLTFLTYLAVSTALALLAVHVLPAGASLAQIKCLTGGGALLAYTVGGLSHAIWYGRPWRLVAKEVVEGVVFALVTAWTFGWLWPS